VADGTYELGSFKQARRGRAKRNKKKSTKKTSTTQRIRTRDIVIIRRRKGSKYSMSCTRECRSGRRKNGRHPDSEASKRGSVRGRAGP